MPGQAAREHRLARARRADHQQVVAAGSGDLERPLRVRAGRGRRRGRARSTPRPAGEALRSRQAERASTRPSTQLDDPLQVGAPQHLEPLDQGRLRRVLAGHDQPPKPASRAPSAIASAPRTGRSAPPSDSSPQTAQRAERFGRQLTARRQQADGERQVEARARLAQVRGREVGGEPLRAGTREPEFSSAARTRSRASRTAASGRPTTVNAGSPRRTSTSTVTSRLSTPSRANVATLASTRRG